MLTVCTEYPTYFIGDSALYRNLNIYICLYLFFTIFLSHIYDFTTMIFTVPMWGFEAANSKTEIDLTNTPSEVTWAYDVTTVERECDFTLLGICYCIW